MPLKTGAIEETKLNLTPMIDVVFLLIIFFMVGTRFAEMERSYEVDLPTVTDAQPLTNLPDEIVVNILKNGEIVVNDNEQTLKQLDDRLEAARKNYADQGVTVRADGKVPYQSVMDVLAICDRNNIKNISLANRLRQEGE